MKNFTQLCVWPGTVVGSENVKKFEKMFKDDLGVRVKYAEEFETLPDLDKDDNPVNGTGGRNELLFYVHSDDVDRFAVPRLQMGIRWWEDAIAPCNGGGRIYPVEILEKHPNTWEKSRESAD